MRRVQKDEEITCQSKDHGSMKEEIDKLTDDVIAQTIQTPEPGPPVVRVSLVGWRVTLEVPGDEPVELNSSPDKKEALMLAAAAAHAQAIHLSGLVELREQDKQGRHISTRYFNFKEGK